MSLFVTGTDTGVGKTYTAACLLRLARAAGLRCAGMKPICCGDREDAKLLLAASSEGLTIDEVNPVWLRTAAAPLPAAEAEHVAINRQQLLDQLAQLRSRFNFVVVEGVGGWMVPIAEDYFVKDLAAEMKLPVLVVALNRLGCLNHTMLTLSSIAASRARCVGIVLNSPTARDSDFPLATNRDVLSRITSVPILPQIDAQTASIPPEWAHILRPSAMSS